ncbi:sensor histidine kinase [Promicromonospora sukumoe]|uniref:sensor histidine kinase n=1 Tax=Promicromonospora sukumoe TaxID=88382 RepID=UPI0037C90E75
MGVTLTGELGRAEEPGRLERWERRLDVQLRVVPFVLLAVSFCLYWLVEEATVTARLTAVGLVAAAAVWLTLGAGRRPWPPALHVTGLVALIGMLGQVSVWFPPFFGFVGFLDAWQRLVGPWRYVGVAATAAVSVIAYAGVPGAAVELVTFLVLTAAITCAVAFFSFVGDVAAERSAERTRTVDRLAAALQENAGLQAQLLVQAREAGILDERQRIAAEIHDTLAQGLAGIIAQLEAAGTEDWRVRVEKSVRLARANLAEARRTVHAVAPAELEDTPLPEALAALVAAWADQHGVRADLTVTGTVLPMPPEIEGVLLRVTQESLSNSAKHAEATRLAVTLSYMEDEVALDVRDDGRGFDPVRSAGAGGFGISSMRRRVERFGGVLTVESEPHNGTAVSAVLPYVARDGEVART